MREDGPTLPNMRSYATGASGEGEEPGGSPTWPIDRGHNHPSSTNYLIPLMLGASLVLNVVLLIGLLSVLVLGRSGLFSQGGSSAGSSSPVPTGSSASPRVSSPTGVSSPTAASGWLQVSTTSVQLGCDIGQQTEFVVLKNTGTTPVHWQATFSVPVDQAGVNISPNQGTLNPSTNMPLQIQNQMHAHGPQGGAGQQGSIEFTSDTPGAGLSPSLTYTTVGCN